MAKLRTYAELKSIYSVLLIIAVSIWTYSCAPTKRTPVSLTTHPLPSQAKAQPSEIEPISSATKLRNAASLITNDLAAAFSQDEKLKVVIMPFSEMDGMTVNYLGSYLSDKINNELVVAAPQLDVLERSRIEDVINELELGMSGLLDDATVQEAGRALGADVIIVGSLAVIGRRDLEGSEIEINVRVISISLMKAVASSSHSLLPDVAIWDMMDRQMSGQGLRKTGSGRSSSRGSGFVDDFNPSTVKYRFFNPYTGHAMGKYILNDDAGWLEIRSADNTGLGFSTNLSAPTKTGKITVTFTPTWVFPDSGQIAITVTSTRGDGYHFLFPKSHYKSGLFYIIGGNQQLIWDRKGDSFGLNQKHTMTLEYSPERIVGLFDGVKIFDARNNHDFTVETFTISTFQMNCCIELLEIN
ncbi:MAG: CsgG/HfaB family protein [Bacteroidales bacterium]|nr:CsgG/HfaB family protein [Candidatus Latescibacterota bacterium]